MSTRPQTKPHTVINAQSMAADITSTPTILSNQSIVSYAFSWSGTSPVGTISVQASSDAQFDSLGNYVAASGTWNSLPLNTGGSVGTTVAVSGNTGNGLIDINTNGLYTVRAIYTAGSGTGTLTGIVVGKVA